MSVAPTSPSRFYRWAGAGFFLALAATCAALWFGRAQTLQSLGSSEATQAWRDWRDDTAKQSKDKEAPIARRESKAMEPPLLILMRDHFTPVVVTTLLMVTILYWFLALAIRGSMHVRASPPTPSRSEVFR